MRLFSKSHFVGLLIAFSCTLGCIRNAQTSNEGSPALSARDSDETEFTEARGDALQIDLPPDATLGPVVRTIFQDSNGMIWFGGEGDLFRFDGASVTAFDIRDAYDQGVTVKQIIEDLRGNIWCGTTGGITRIDGDSITSFGRQDGLLNDDVWSLAADDDGTLWIGTMGGAFRFDGQEFSEFAIPESQPDPTRGVTSGKIVHCITVDREGRIWFGTNGGAYVYDGNELSNYSQADGLPSDVVHNILADSQGKIWFGTTHGGISRWDGQEYKNFTADGLIDGKEIWCLHEDGAGNIWFSGKHLGVIRYDGSSFLNVDAQGDTGGSIMTILSDKDGNLWLGGATGLFRYRKGKFTKVTKLGPWRANVGAMWKNNVPASIAGESGCCVSRFHNRNFPKSVCVSSSIPASLNAGGIGGISAGPVKWGTSRTVLTNVPMSQNSIPFPSCQTSFVAGTNPTTPPCPPNSEIDESCPVSRFHI